jgi:hypothetical protein
MPRIFPKVDGRLDKNDFGPLAHPPHIFDSKSGVEIHVFRGQDGIIDYSNRIAVMTADDTELTLPNQDLPPNTIWHYVRKAYARCCCKYSEPSPPCIVIIDANGNMIGAMPNAPTNLVAEPIFGGKIRLRWRYSRYAQEIPPTGFRIYMAQDGGFDFTEPHDSTEYQFRGEFQWTSDFLVHGQKYKFCVRSYRDGAGESQNTNFAAATADSEGPEPITVMQISVQEI